jgi:DNA-binding cell septation regulator SpoVG
MNTSRAYSQFKQESKAPKLQIRKFTKLDNGALRASFSVLLQSGLQIHDVLLFTKGDSRWLCMPSKKFDGKDGKPVYRPMVDFGGNRNLENRFRDQVMNVLEAESLLDEARPEITDDDVGF